MTTDLVRVTDERYEPRDLTDAVRVAGMLVASRLLPRSVQTPEQAVTIIATGRELGFSMMQSLRLIHVVEGKPTLSADAMASLVMRSPVCEYLTPIEMTDARCVYEAKRKGAPKPVTLAYTIQQAQAAGLTGKDNWKKHTAAMLRARALSSICRAVFPDLVAGVYDPDELDRGAPVAPAPVPVVRDVTPPVIDVPVVPVVEAAAPVVESAPSPDDDGREPVGQVFATRIRAAATRAELDAIVPEIKAAGLSQSDAAVVRSIWAERAKEVR